MTKNEVVEVDVSAVAPAGYLLTIEQAVGTCGDSTVNTPMFRVRHTDAKGNITFEEIENMENKL